MTKKEAIARKHDVNDIHLQIDSIEFFYKNPHTGESGMIISWSSEIGFGEYTIYMTSEGELMADAETMDCNEDKAFGRKLMELLMDMVDIRR